MSQSDVACLAYPATELLGLVVMVKAPSSADGFGIRIASAALAYGGLGRGSLLQSCHDAASLLEAYLADGMPLQWITATLVPIVLGHGLSLTTLVADAICHLLGTVSCQAQSNSPPVSILMYETYSERSTVPPFLMFGTFTVFTSSHE
jgi:hypothetical protein